MALPGGWRHLLAGCDPAQIEAITSPAAPLLVVAGAGSGKTRVLTRRIAWRIAQEQAVARHVLALTFTRKAAGELRGRLAALGLPAPVTAGTFHAVALAQLRRHAAERGRQPPVLLDSKARLLGPLVAGHAPRRPAMGGGTRNELLGALATEIEWAKGRLVGPSGYAAAAAAAGRPEPLGRDAVASVYAAYEQLRRRRGLVDFDDLLLDLVQAIEADRELAAAQRWQFAHLFVDELQDATTLQLRLVSSWLGGRDDLFAVGDPRQSVYAFNGADPEAIAGFQRRHRGATVIELSTNYRCSPQVVALATAALPGADTQGPRSGRPDGPVPRLCRYLDDAAEAAGIAASLRRAHRPGRPWSACAVLARTNAQLEVVADALAAAGIPVGRPGAAGLLDEAAARKALEELPPHLDGPRLRAVVAERAAEAAAAGGDQAAFWAVLADLAEEHGELDPSASAAGFAAFVRAASRESPALDGRDAVALSTFHRAKGLEWEVVFVAGLEAGFVPISHARSRAAVDEERRLLYVALTRASEELHCSWAAERRFGARRVEREPSPWLAALESARRRLEALARPGTVAEALAASRAALAAASPPPEGEPSTTR